MARSSARFPCARRSLDLSKQDDRDGDELLRTYSDLGKKTWLGLFKHVTSAFGLFTRLTRERRKINQRAAIASRSTVSAVRGFVLALSAISSFGGHRRTIPLPFLLMISLTPQTENNIVAAVQNRRSSGWPLKQVRGFSLSGQITSLLCEHIETSGPRRLALVWLQ